jgi:hypothetical protein
VLHGAVAERKLVVWAEAAPLARRLGGFPFWRGEEDFARVIKRACLAAERRAVALWLGPEPGPEEG